MNRIHMPNTDLVVSTICFGAAGFGSAVRGDDLARLIDQFRQAGGNFFDTAHCYSFWEPGCDGASERALANHFRSHGGRDEVVIATKGGHPTRPRYRTVDQYLSPGRVSADIDDSLARLDCEQIDLYYLHRDDLRLSVAEIIDHLNTEIARGRIRYLGASNWSAPRIAEANAYAAQRGLRGFVASQPQWNLGCFNADSVDDPSLQFMTDEDITWHSQSHLPAIPYTSTAKGYFADPNRPAASRGYDNPVSRARLARVRELAGKLGCTPTQLALAWLTNHPFPVIPIIGTSNPEHLAEQLKAVDVRLSAEQVEWLKNG